jgi:hypothetical protein
MNSVSSGHIVMQTLICTRKSVHMYEKSSFSLLSVAFTFRWWGQYGTCSEGSGAPKPVAKSLCYGKGPRPAQATVSLRPGSRGQDLYNNGRSSSGYGQVSNWAYRPPSRVTHGEIRGVISTRGQAERKQ